MKHLVLILFGPTASGKTALLDKLSRGGNPSPLVMAEHSPALLDKLSRGGNPLAGKASIEVISADSMQVYRGMDIGTAKPSAEEQSRIRHHLIDVKDPNEQFSAGDFVRCSEAACLDAESRGALPVVSGGTAFYLQNLILGLSEAPPSDHSIRAQLAAELASRGAASLMAELAFVDSVSAKRIHINDEYRILRALEVYRTGGRPLSSYASAWTQVGKTDTAHHVQNTVDRGQFRFIIVGLRRNREALYQRINARTKAMFEAGLAAEVKRLYDSGYTPDDPGMRAIGYREFFIENDTLSLSQGSGRRTWRLSEDIPAVQALIAQNSRRYAKRQITFFASLPNVHWLDCEGSGDPAEKLQEIVENGRC